MVLPSPLDRACPEEGSGWTIGGTRRMCACSCVQWHYCAVQRDACVSCGRDDANRHGRRVRPAPQTRDADLFESGGSSMIEVLVVSGQVRAQDMSVHVRNCIRASRHFRKAHSNRYGELRCLRIPTDRSSLTRARVRLPCCLVLSGRLFCCSVEVACSGPVGPSVWLRPLVCSVSV